MKMKKMAATLLAGIMVLSLTACGSSDTDTTTNEGTETTTEVTEAAGKEIESAEETAEVTEEAEETTGGDVSGTIVITGSTSVEKILIEMKDEFCAMYPNVTIEYTGSGSSAGIKDTKAGTNNIGASSRELKEDEVEDTLKTEVFAYDGIAVIVNPANEAVSDITVEQLADIYSGKITNWSEVGGADADIFVVSREESSGTRSAFEELIALEDAGGLASSAAVS